MVPMDPILIEQVLSNLIENAVIHGETTTAIHLQREKTEDNFAAFSVRDNGQGISPAAAAPLYSIIPSAMPLAPPETASGTWAWAFPCAAPSSRPTAARLTAHNHPDGAEFIFCSARRHIH